MKTLLSSKIESPNAFDGSEPMVTSITITENKDKHRLEVHLRGIIPEPEHLSEALTTLYTLSEEYHVCALFINSPGGSMYTTTELASVFKKFETLITVGAGNIASAGFILWCLGDIRVLQDHISIMCHRESHLLGYMKTDQYLDFAHHNAEVYGQLVDEFCSSVLASDELEKIRYTEIFLTSTELVEREAAISWDTFINGESKDITVVQYATIDEVPYIISQCGQYAFSIEDETFEEPYSIHELMYA